MSTRLRHCAALTVAAMAAALLPSAVVGAASAAPPTPTPYFSPVDGFSATGAKVRVRPVDYEATRLDLPGARSALAAAPHEGGDGSGSDSKVAGGLRFALPTPDGGSAQFSLQRTDIMESALAAQHPEIATYSGVSTTDPQTGVAIDVTPMGLHAAVRGPHGQRAWYVDPAYNVRGTTTYLSYYGAAVPRAEQDFVERDARDTRRITSAAPAKTGEEVLRRDFRLALTSDPSYAAYFGTDNVLAEKVTLINRVNQIYNDDLAIRMRLVNATDKLNLDTVAEAVGSNGPCGSAPCFEPPVGDDPDAPDYVPGDLDYCSGDTLARNRTVLGQLVGASNYDVGHIALGVNGGGVAYLGVTGLDYKGGGCTGLPFPKGDFFAVDYVAHELGHQFNGNHTFNGCGPGNRNGATSVEPGGGSSVMAYAGICGQDDLQPHSDPYFSQRTIDEATSLATARGLNVTEVQTVSLRGFDTDGERITLGFGNRARTLTRGGNYTAAGIRRVVERLTGQDVTVSGWGYDPYAGYGPYPAPLTRPDDRGFQVIFNSTALPEAPGPQNDVKSLTVLSGDAGVSGFVGETAKGGPGDNGGNVVTPSGNRAPVVTAPADKTIPLRTPFVLTGSATDADGNPLTYLWEQNDIGADDRFDDAGDPTFYGGTDLVSNRKRTGPLFRVFGTSAQVTDEGALQSPSPGLNLADGSPTRVFPDLAQVLAGNTNAATGRCPAPPSDPDAAVPLDVVDCYSEFLPRKGYRGSFNSASPRMDFRLTARDGAPNGGGTGHDDVVLRLAQNAGPFLVRSQASPRQSVRAGAVGTVRWAVSGTNTPALARRVRITLSTDGGRTFGRVLAADTPNDGSQAVTWPSVGTRQARIKVEAVGNYFFAVNAAPFSISR